MFGRRDGEPTTAAESPPAQEPPVPAPEAEQQVAPVEPEAPTPPPSRIPEPVAASTEGDEAAAAEPPAPQTVETESVRKPADGTVPETADEEPEPPPGDAPEPEVPPAPAYPPPRAVPAPPPRPREPARAAPRPSVERSAREPVVRMPARPSRPVEWNLWDLERLAREETRSSPERAQEWSYLFVYLRQFASPGGTLPSEFDPLVRESFGTLLGRVAHA